MTEHPPNRLAEETSPYLLQHAHNPVDWFAWGEEAFTIAREQNKPIFLSVGYSACHWCHVMERESFEHPEMAALMNQWFVNIKVDREERPDIDQIYMSAVQLVTGQGGWPMSVFLTPEGKPFYGGTYWPPISRQGMLGFADVLSKIHDYWVNHNEECLSKSQELVTAIDEMHHHVQAECELDIDLLRHAEHRLMQNADSVEGGFGNAPKFPHPVDLRVLLRAWKRFGNEQTLAAVTLTLDKMAAGGIYDHLGGGFARYSTDRVWLVPHFEKMLYDNSQLVSVYLEAFQATGDIHYARVVRETLEYVEREMTDASGGFYSTQDADSEGVEGKFYVWSAEEIESLLGPADAELFAAVYEVSQDGNWEGVNILHRKQALETVAAKFELSVDDLEAKLAQAREILLQVRNKRIWPGRDEKMIVAWNGLMISAFAQAARVIDEPAYLNVAKRAADFLLAELVREDGSLWHCCKDGRNRFNGFLDDYACFIDGLSDLYQISLDPKYFTAATKLARTMLMQFYDADAKAFHYTPADHENLIVRVRDRYDSAIPSGSNLAINCLIRLGALADRSEWIELAGEVLQAVSGTIRQQPSGMGQAIVALDHLLGPAEQLVIVAGAQDDPFNLLLKKLASRFEPLQIILAATPSTDRTSGTPLLAEKTAIDAQVTLYRCQLGRCDAPAVGFEAIEQHL